MSVHSAMRAKRHWTEMKRTWVLIWLLDFILWLSLPVRYGDYRFSLRLEEGGETPGSIMVMVRDLEKKPVPNLRVATQSHSGSTSDVLTDARGRAVITTSESEVTAIFIDERDFGFELPHSWSPLNHFASLPSCERGLKVYVTMKSR
jgi:hypothetical protein